MRASPVGSIHQESYYPLVNHIPIVFCTNAITEAAQIDVQTISEEEFEKKLQLEAIEHKASKEKAQAVQSQY